MFIDLEAQLLQDHHQTEAGTLPESESDDDQDETTAPAQSTPTFISSSSLLWVIRSAQVFINSGSAAADSYSVIPTAPPEPEETLLINSIVHSHPHQEDQHHQHQTDEAGTLSESDDRDHKTAAPGQSTGKHISSSSLLWVIRSAQVFIKSASAAAGSYSVIPTAPPEETLLITSTVHSHFHQKSSSSPEEHDAAAESRSKSTRIRWSFRQLCRQEDEDLGRTPSLLSSTAIQVEDTASRNQHQSIELQRISKREHIIDIVRRKSYEDLVGFGGVEVVAEALDSHLYNGISNIPPEEISSPDDRKNLHQILCFKTLFNCFLRACKSYTVFLLSIAAACSLAFGIDEKGVYTGWLNGTVIIITIFVLIICTSVQDYVRQRKYVNSFMDIAKITKDVRVVRGDCVVIPAYELRVGDVACLQKGDEVPGDGIFVPGDQSVKLDVVLDGSRTTVDVTNPFIFYGSRVISGSCRMVVTSVGMDTRLGEMIRKELESLDYNCKFESYLDKLNTSVQLSGVFISILINIVLFVHYKGGGLDDENGFKPDIEDKPARVKVIVAAIMSIVIGSGGSARVLITLLSVSLIGIMEVMPVIISLALSIWNDKVLLAHNASWRHDRLAFLTMASVTVICMDLSGGLMKNENEISKVHIGNEFVNGISKVASCVSKHLCDGIATHRQVPLGDGESKVESLISWAEEEFGMKKDTLGGRCRVSSPGVHNPFQECCQVSIKEDGNEGVKRYLHCNGPAEKVLECCSFYYDAEGVKQCMNGERKNSFKKVIKDMRAEDEAKVVGYACKEVNASDEASDEAKDMVFIGMISLISTKREDMKRAVSKLKEGGVRTILVSGDDIASLKQVGEYCEIHANEPDGLVITAKEFRDWSPEVRMTNVEKITIMGNCLPSDKILLIKCLREKENTVALLAQRTVDSPALKVADVGLTFWNRSSEVARESAHFTICNGDFSFLVDVIERARSFQANVRKFIQLQLITTISSTCINFVSVVFLSDASMTAIQLFWLNLVIAVCGGSTLLLSPPSEVLTNMPPVRSFQKLVITKAMWRNIFVQASYQTSIFVMFQLKGQVLFGITSDQVKSMVYNGFFLCQTFNIFVARQPVEINIFRGMFNMKNWWNFGSAIVIIICQGMFQLANMVIRSSSGLNWRLWCLCLAIGLFCLPTDFVGKMMISSDFLDSLFD